MSRVLQAVLTRTPMHRRLALTVTLVTIRLRPLRAVQFVLRVWPTVTLIHPRRATPMLQHALRAALVTLARLTARLVSLVKLMWMAIRPHRVKRAALEPTRLSRRHRATRVLQAVLTRTPMHRRLAPAVQSGSTQRAALRHVPTVLLALLTWILIRRLLATAAALEPTRQQVLQYARAVLLVRPT